MDHVTIGNFEERTHLVVKRALLILAGQILADGVVFTNRRNTLLRLVPRKWRYRKSDVDEHSL